MADKFKKSGSPDTLIHSHSLQTSHMRLPAHEIIHVFSTNILLSSNQWYIFWILKQSLSLKLNLQTQKSYLNSSYFVFRHLYHKSYMYIFYWVISFWILPSVWPWIIKVNTICINALFSHLSVIWLRLFRAYFACFKQMS